MIDRYDWYNGNFAQYEHLEWLHETDVDPIMPWTVLDVHPCGYIVFQSAGGTKFKMLNKPVVVIGDVIS